MKMRLGFFLAAMLLIWLVLVRTDNLRGGGFTGDGQQEPVAVLSSNAG